MDSDSDPDPDPDPDKTLDPTPFFKWLSVCKKINIFAKIFNFILQALFQSARTLYEKRAGSGSVLWLTDPGGPKSCESCWSEFLY